MSDVLEQWRSAKERWIISGEANEMIVGLENEIERLREALREMLSVAEVDQLENLSICDIGSERSKMKSRAVASRCGMLLGKLRKIARAALGEGKE